MQKLYPTKSVFDSLKKKYNMIPLFTKLRINEDVLSIYKKLRGRNTFILHSSMADKELGRYSFIGFEPFLIIKSKGMRIFVNNRQFSGNPIRFLREKLSLYRGFRHNRLPLFFGGAVGYFSYNAAHFFEKLPTMAVDDMNLSDTYFMFIDKSLIYDHLREELFIVALGSDYGQLTQRISQIIKQIDVTPKHTSNKIMVGEWISNFSKEEYVKAILKIKEYIRAGDTFQVNLSQRFAADISGDALAVYERLVRINPSPFSAFVELDDTALLCSSPERLVRLENGFVSTRPIAGTRKRGKTRYEDLRLERVLLRSEKECAEHAMLVDLERNDLGRVCSYGTVKVSEFMRVERYSHVMHLVSNITGKLHTGMDIFDVLRAVFPGGTITGCPKIRTMEIIDEIEPNARGVYTGSLGYFNFSGEMDFNIIIRTLIMKNNRIYAHAGGGIVADSIPEHEYKETLYKAEAMKEALGR